MNPKTALVIGVMVGAITSGCVSVPLQSQQPGVSQPSQTIEFYNPNGSRAGYGKVGPGGSVEFFNPNSSRSGFGKGR